MEKELPGMVEALVEKFHDDCVDRSGRFRVSAKEKTGIAKFFSDSVRLRPRIEMELGIGRGALGATSPLVAIFGGSVQVFRNLPPEQRRDALLKALRGEPDALPAQLCD